MSLTIIKDKDIIYDVEKFDVVLVGTSIHNQLVGGFQRKMSYKYPKMVEVNDKTKVGDRKKFGTRLTLDDGKPIISIMYICDYPRSTSVTVDYEALEKCLLTANAEFKGKKVVTTVLGSSVFDGNGDKEKCYEIIKRCTPDLKLTIYDYQQKKIAEEIKEQRKYLKSLEYTDKDKYEKLKSVFDIYLKKLYLTE